MVVVLTVQVLDVERHAGRLGEGLEPFLEQFGVHIAQLVAGEIDLPDQVGAVRQVQRHAGQRLIHRDGRLAIAADALAVAQRLREGGADRDAAVLGRMVEVDMQVAFRLDRQVDQAVARQLLKHMVEKADACGNLVHACTIQVQRNLDPGLVGGALQAGLARGSVGKSVHVPVLAGRRRRRQRPMNSLWTVRPVVARGGLPDCPRIRMAG